MANEKNLMPIEEVNSRRSREQHSADSRKGGVASGAARRRKKKLRDAVDIYLGAEVTDVKQWNQLALEGIEPEDIDRQMLMVAGLARAASEGDAKAARVLVDIIGEEKEEAGEQRPYDIPAKVVGRAFIDLIRDIKPNVAYVLEGGRGSLKSSIIAIICIWVIKNYPDIHAVITRQVAATLKRSVYAKMKWAIKVLGLEDEFKCLISPLEITYLPTGQKIYFSGLDDETKLKSIAPEFGYIGFLWKEEKDQMKGPEQERSVNQSVLRGGQISFDFSSYNPPKSKDNWVNQELLIPNPKRIVNHSTYLDAPPEWLGTKFLEDAEHLKKVNPEAYEHEYLGVPNGAGGNVFEFLEAKEITDTEIQQLCQIYQGTDWGWYPDPYAFVRVNYDPNREEIIFIDENYVNKQKNSQTGQWIIDHKYLDFDVTCDSAEHKSTQDYRDMGIPARNAKKGPGSVDYSMKWLAGKRIIIDPRRCPNAWREFSQYEYERDKQGNVISGYPDANNHTIDATRYALEQVWRKRFNHA